MYRYFPSCNFNIASPKSSKALRMFLKERMPVAGCCRFDKTVFEKNDKAIIVCQACRDILSDKVDIVSLYEYLDLDDSFEWPNYQGIKMNLQDCFRDRNYPKVHEAVRHILNKMHIEVAEIEHNQGQADFCGTLHYEPKSDALKEVLKAYPNVKISKLPIEIQEALMQEHVALYECEYVIVDCNRCKKGVELGGGKAVHLIDLIFGNTDIAYK